MVKNQSKEISEWHNTFRNMRKRIYGEEMFSNTTLSEVLNKKYTIQ